MTVTTTRPISLAGTNLQTYGYNIELIDGFYGRAGRRGKNRPTPYLDGAYSFSKKFYEERKMILRMGVYPFDVDGLQTYADPFEHLYENTDTIFGLLHSDDLISLRRTMPDGAGTKVREIFVESNREAKVQGTTPSSYRIVVELLAPRPFWRDLPVVSSSENSISSFPHAFNIVTGGNAPIGDAKITFACTADGANPKLSIPSLDEYIQFASTMTAGDSVVFDLATRTFTYNTARADASIRRNRAWFLRLPPGESALGMSFDADSGTFNCTIERYNQWL